MLGVPDGAVAGRAFPEGCGMKICKRQFAALVADAPRLTVRTAHLGCPRPIRCIGCIRRTMPRKWNWPPGSRRWSC